MILMKKSLFILLFFLLFFTQHLIAQNIVRLKSPDGRIDFSLKANEDVPVYSIAFKKKPLIENSSLNLDLEEGRMLRQAFISQAQFVKK